ncbi:MAG: site-specific DNA-methyltransferase [Phycisphaerales bacterium]|nr:site-specific DNA-methyltransferase [Phycisphaerales bacterium]
MSSKQQRLCTVAPQLECHLVPIGTITGDPANLRLHGPRSIEAIKASFRRFGQQKPIVVDAYGVTIAGAGQLEAAKQLGWTHIAAVKSNLAGADRVAYAIADNRTAELSAWDEESLAATLAAMSAVDLESLSFSAAELADLIGGTGSGVVQDEIPQPPTPGNAVARPGELWHLGEHRLLVGDCTVEADVVRVMDGQRAQLVATDPPYLVGYDGTNHPQSFTGGGSRDWSETYGTSWDDNDPDSPLYRLFIQMGVKHAGAPEAAWYIWHASRRQSMLEAAMQDAGLLVHCQIIWAKNRPVLTRTWYMWRHEPCLMGWLRGNKPAKRSSESHSTVWEIDTIANGDDRPDHPTPKPLEVYAIPIQQHTLPGELLYEPFAGSGTAIIAAEQLGRRCFAIEKQPIYVDVCIARWQKLTGRAATLGSMGATWQEVKDARQQQPVPPSTVPPVPAATSDAEPTVAAVSARGTRGSGGQDPRRTSRPRRMRGSTELPDG